MKTEDNFHTALRIATKALAKNVDAENKLILNWEKRKKEIKYQRKSQEEKILIFLKKGYSITPIIALNLFGCYRLSARICRLKGRGHTILSEPYKVPRSNKRVAKYTLKR